ncbi:MAG: PDZ domain-containing protein [Alphaproteobacteria bacterium]|nr:PDZ domain-containing protein [Alphaproteobacteria bacterium]
MRKWVLAAGLTVLLMPAAALPQAKNTDKGSVYEQLNLFSEAFERIRQDSVEPVTDTKLVETAIAGMLSGLDPRSVYMNETEYKALKGPANEEAASPGLVVTLDNGQLKVVSPRDGSPAANAGVKPGDFIFTIDKEPTYDLTLPEIEQKLRGPEGSEVTLMVRRGTGTPFEIKLKRAAGKGSTVSTRVEGGDVGYVRLAGFDQATAAALGDAVKQVRQQAGNKLTGFIIDLRNNPGGAFDAAVAVADDFIDKGDIAIVKSHKGDTAKHIAATPGDLASGLPIVALVNGGTAREAELVAGALQDNHRAVLLGTKTFGESAIETIIPLNGNGAIKLTTARFTTPSGRAIQGKGLDPDLTVSPLKLEKVAQADRRREADLRGALKNPADTGPDAAKSGAPAPTSGAAPGDAPSVPPAPGKEPSATTQPAKGEQPSVASGDIGTTSDEQLSEAIDVLRGLALVNGRTTAAAR